jgi:hypothetical protein
VKTGVIHVRDEQAHRLARSAAQKPAIVLFRGVADHDVAVRVDEVRDFTGAEPAERDRGDAMLPERCGRLRHQPVEQVVQMALHIVRLYRNAAPARRLPDPRVHGRVRARPGPMNPNP